MVVRIMLALLLAAGLGSAASAQERLRVGVLECIVEGGAGFIFGSSKSLGCTFRPAGGGPGERYSGNITRFGIDIGATSKTDIVWAVLAPTTQLTAGALEGTYVGVSAEATAGVGVGANALVGGFDRSVILNPVSVQTQTGVDIAAGIAGLRLNALQ